MNYIIKKFRDRYLKCSILIIIVILIGIYLKNRMVNIIPKENIESFYTTLIATVLGGIISIILTLTITKKQNRQKAIFERKYISTSL